METHSIRPETMVSGFSHFVWLTLLYSLIVGIDPLTLLVPLSSITAGATALLGTAIVGASYFLGALANRLLGDLSMLITKSSSPSSISAAIRENKDIAFAMESSWKSKSMFRSVAVAGFFILLFSMCLISKFGLTKTWMSLFIIGVPIETATIVAFFTQRHQYLKERKELLNHE